MNFWFLKNKILDIDDFLFLAQERNGDTSISVKNSYEMESESVGASKGSLWTLFAGEFLFLYYHSQLQDYILMARLFSLHFLLETIAHMRLFYSMILL